MHKQYVLKRIQEVRAIIRSTNEKYIFPLLDQIKPYWMSSGYMAQIDFYQIILLCKLVKNVCTNS